MVINVRNLRFRYPRGDSDVLRGVDFEIQEGEVFGFLGPNGSGKSTTQKILTKILPGYQGTVEVFGQDVARLQPDYYNRIGVSFEFPNLYEKLTAEENLGFYREFFDGPTDRPAELLEALNLPVGDARRVGAYSKGMKMRLVLARSLINRPRLWFLDEPTTGQDPRHAVLIRNLIRARADAGVTVFLTTHDMTVADLLCDRIALINDGVLAIVDSPRDLKRRYRRGVVRVEYAAGAGDPAAEEFQLDDAASKRALADALVRREVERIYTLEPTLEDVFLDVTGRPLE